MNAELLYLDSVDNRDINLYINSPGGSVVDGLSVIDTMNFIKSDVSTTCMGMAASMGSVLLSNGTKGKRFVLPHSRVMIHSVASGFQGHTADVRIEMEQTERCQKDVYQILADNTGHTFEEMEKLCDRDNWFIGDEAVNNLHIADKVIVPTNK
jgi:ATP-dependent Clp protease protease subunit